MDPKRARRWMVCMMHKMTGTSKRCRYIVAEKCARRSVWVELMSVTAVAGLKGAARPPTTGCSDWHKIISKTAILPKTENLIYSRPNYLYHKMKRTIIGRPLAIPFEGRSSTGDPGLKVKGKGRTLVIALLCRHSPPQRRSGTWRAPSSVAHTCLIPSQP